MAQRGNEMQVDVAAGLGQRGILMSEHEVIDHVLDGNYRPAPTRTYRALAALIERGGVHGLESLESIVACGCERRRHVPILSIRERYGVLGEAVPPHVPDGLSRVAGRPGFTPARQVFEVRGPYARRGSDGAPA